jgi:hypothetical protein
VGALPGVARRQLGGGREVQKVAPRPRPAAPPVQLPRRPLSGTRPILCHPVLVL